MGELAVAVSVTVMSDGGGYSLNAATPYKMVQDPALYGDDLSHRVAVPPYVTLGKEVTEPCVPADLVPHAEALATELFTQHQIARDAFSATSEVAPPQGHS